MKSNQTKAFTLIELLVVISIIVILVALILSVLPLVHQKEARARTQGEMTGIAAALELFKNDNGTYPNDAKISSTGGYTSEATDTLDARTMNDPTKSQYTNAAMALYRSITGDRNGDRAVTATDMTYDLGGNAGGASLAAPPPNYFNYPGVASMLLPSGTGNVTNFVDAFGYNYGYSTAYAGAIATSGTNTNITVGYNPTYDLWSTGGQVGQSGDSTTQTQARRGKWMINWQNSGANVGQ
jgi:prepilin-type N-terminal cleavage/methylation domain-containing protein